MKMEEKEKYNNPRKDRKPAYLWTAIGVFFVLFILSLPMSPLFLYFGSFGLIAISLILVLLLAVLAFAVPKDHRDPRSS